MLDFPISRDLASAASFRFCSASHALFSSSLSFHPVVTNTSVSPNSARSRSCSLCCIRSYAESISRSRTLAFSFRLAMYRLFFRSGALFKSCFADFSSCMSSYTPS